MADESIKKGLQFLENMRQKIDNLKLNKDNNPLLVLKSINQKLKTDHLGIIILLHNKKYLVRLFQQLIKYFQQNKDKNKQIIEQIQIIYAIGHSCFFIYENGYDKFFNYFQKKVSKGKIQKYQQKCKKQNTRYQIMFKLFKDFYQLNRFEGQNFQKGKKLNQYVERFKFQIPSNAYEEPLFTWLRIRIEILQNQIINKTLAKDYGLCCCRLHFLENSSENGVQTFGQNFHRNVDFKRLKQKQDIPIHKQIVSYLNSYGGIIYLGIEVSPTKVAQIHGIPIDEPSRRTWLSNILQIIIKKIFPDDQENEDQDDKQQEQRINKTIDKKKKQLDKCPFYQSKFHYDLTKYISVDFINLYNSQTWFYSRSGNSILYIIRIKVKKGDQYEVYHYINMTDIPKAYYREDKKQKQLTMIEYYDQIYVKLKNKAEKRQQQQKILQFHPLCRFKIKLQEDKNK